ncbi:hypothetical protein KZO53_05795 [Prevotella melaninogenica]|uniref:hypothetical protein n=1 Tax=Prevotella melaninogenica TaxID=28132 RepID=UPI001C60607C|nr:hypothetical protein [Prevotella melaninogenica]MBW4762010.1 hypothetical protein [Prevotella melaninogenica]
MKKYLFKTQLLSLAALCGIVLAFASCANEDVAQNTTGPESDNDKNLTAFVAGDEVMTRTSLDYNSGNFYWEAGDYIYVKDDNGVLQKSSNAPTSKVASFKYMVPGKFTASSSYKVYYLGKNSSDNSVTISTNQSQTTPDNTVHFGTVGDYGTATANKVSSKQQFKFELEHQPAYLVFQPYTSNTILHDCYLTKVEVSSDNDIAETYTVNPTTGSLVASSGTGAKQIVLATQDPTSGSTYNNGFPLTNNSASVTTNGAYMVIKPGTHTLRVRYWVKDVATDVEGTITKTYSSTAYASNTYYDMTADLNVKDYRGDKYYMWDAQQNYWSGHEWNSANPWQPTLTSQPANPNYPQSNTDLRYRNEAFTYGVDNPATHTSCKDLPNVNEMTWYAAKGDPRWDADELWTTMGHLYKGGMWFKKKSVLQAEGNYNTEKSVDGTDWRTNGRGSSWSASQTLPSAADANKYFYLPVLGYYYSGQLYGVGDNGNYWSSSAFPWGSYTAYYLRFGSDDVNVYSTGRINGVRAEAFQ